jgi:hypothetical protein
MIRSFAKDLFKVQSLKFCFFALMISIPHKAKHFLVLPSQSFDRGWCILFHLQPTGSNDKLDWAQFITNSKKPVCDWDWSYYFLSVINRYLEILKWQNLLHTSDLFPWEKQQNMHLLL